MFSEANTPLSEYNRTVRFRRTLAVMRYQVENGASVQEACKACNVPERTFYRWISEGTLDDYLAECSEGWSKAVAAQALEAVGAIMMYMIEIASGAKVVRGANPIAAAKFVFKFAGLEPYTRTPKSDGNTDVLLGMPKQVQFLVVDGSPVLDKHGRVMIIDGELKESTND